MLTNGRYAVYHMIPKEDGVHKHLASVFALKDGGFHLLEDYADVFTKYHTQDGDTPSNLLEHRIRNLVNNSSYYKVIPTKEDNIRDPDSRHKVVTPEDINSARQVFVYHSPHHNGPAQLVFDKGSFHLNGYPLSIAELKHIKGSVEDGSSKISYPDDMFKAEGGSSQPSSNVPSLLRNKIKFNVDKSDMYGIGGLPSATVQLEFEKPEHAQVVFNAIQNNRELRRSGHWAIDHYNGGKTIYAPISFKDYLPAHRHSLLEHQVKTIKSKFKNAGIDFLEEGDISPIDYSQDEGEEPRFRVASPTEEIIPFSQVRYGGDPSKLGKAEGLFEQSDDFFDTDYMCPQIGNLHAYRNFVGGEPQGGSHIFLSSDSVKKVLEDDGVKSHNDILIAIANMLDTAASVPDESGRVFHVGHDSYYVWMPSYEAGLQFLYNLQGLINELPTIYSKHPYFDIGLSDELEEAFNALTQVGEYKEHDGQEGNHVMIHTGNTTRYVSPSDIL